MSIISHNANPDNLIKNGSMTSGSSPWILGTGWEWFAPGGYCRYNTPTLGDLISNGNFSGTDSWVMGAKWAYNSGAGRFTSSGTSDMSTPANIMYQNINAVEGRYYRITLTITLVAPAAPFFRVSIGGYTKDQGNLYSGGGLDHAGLLIYTGTSTHTFIVRARGTDGRIYLQASSFATQSIAIDNISCVETPALLQRLPIATIPNDSNDFDPTHTVTLRASVGGSAGSISFAVFSDDEGVSYDYFETLFETFPASGGGTQEFERLNLRTYVASQYFIVAFFPTQDYNGVIDNVEMNCEKSEPISISGTDANLSGGTNYRVSFPISVTDGSVTLQVDLSSATYNPGEATNIEFDLEYTGEVDLMKFTPTADFVGRIGLIKVTNTDTGEVVYQQTWNSGFGDWTPGYGWTVGPGVVNITNLPSYSTSLLSGVAKVTQGIAAPEFVFGGQYEDSGFALFKKSTDYTLSVFRTEDFHIGNFFRVTALRFSLITPLTADMSLTVIVRNDGNDTGGTSALIVSGDIYTVGQKYFVLTPDTFADGAPQGSNRFYIEFQIRGPDLMVVSLPINVEVTTEPT